MNLAYIPVPPTDSFGFVRIYGITMALGIGLGVYITHKRYVKNHPGSNDIIDIFLPVVVCGIIGARLYHLFTGYDWDSEGLVGVIKLRNGGLSIWGAIIAGALAVFVMARIKKLSFLEIGDAAAPGLLVAQAVGRMGNYFNQELFGRELHAPWALHVDILHRPLGYESVSYFHPTFLYEALWCLGLASVVILIEHKVENWPRAASLALYVSGYCFGRTFFEHLRIDNASRIFGIRFNLLLSMVLCVLGGLWLFYLLVKGKTRPQIDSQSDTESMSAIE